jgi:hypothetical protein
MIPQLVRLSRRSALHQPSWLHTPRKHLKFEIKLHVITEMVKNRQRFFSSTTCSPSQCCETIPLNGQLKLDKIFHNFSKHAGCYFTASSLIELSSLKGCLNIFVFWKLNHYFLLAYMYSSPPNFSVFFFWTGFLLPLAECFRIFRFFFPLKSSRWSTKKDFLKLVSESQYTMLKEGLRKPLQTRYLFSLSRLNIFIKL